MTDIYLEGVVGIDFTNSSVRKELAHAVDPVTVHINSGGGDAHEGNAIYHTLKSRGVDVVITGLAASAASEIAMAGKTITIAAGAYVMIHETSISLTDARHHDLIGSTELVNNMNHDLAKAYAGRTGIPEAEILQMMADETWFTAEQAVAAGFADRVHGQSDEPARITASFKRVPDQLKSRMKEPDVPDTPEKIAADAVAADRKRRSAIAALPQAKANFELAEHLSNETDLTAEQAGKILELAAQSNEAEDMNPEAHAQRRALAYADQRLTAAGAPAPSSSGTPPIVAAMKRRHNVK